MPPVIIARTLPPHGAALRAAPLRAAACAHGAGADAAQRYGTAPRHRVTARPCRAARRSVDQPDLVAAHRAPGQTVRSTAPAVQCGHGYALRCAVPHDDRRPHGGWGKKKYL